MEHERDAADDIRSHHLDEDQLEELLNQVRTNHPPAPASPPGAAAETSPAGDSTIALLEQRIAELEPLSHRLADTEKRRMDLEVQLRVIREERDALAAERVERAALKRRNERLEHELARTRELSETAMRELSETRQHVQSDMETSKDWSREALRLRKQVEKLELAATENRRRLKSAGEALRSAVDGNRPVRRGDLVRLAELMVVDSGDADAVVNEVRRLFPR